jgi:hypothetical protein
LEKIVEPPTVEKVAEPPILEKAAEPAADVDDEEEVDISQLMDIAKFSFDAGSEQGVLSTSSLVWVLKSTTHSTLISL